MLVEKLLKKSGFSEFDSDIIKVSVEKYMTIGMSEKEATFQSVNDYGQKLREESISIKEQIEPKTFR